MELKKCIQCGGKIQFNAEQNLYKCLYCHSEYKPSKPDESPVDESKTITIGGVSFDVNFGEFKIDEGVKRKIKIGATIGIVSFFVIIVGATLLLLWDDFFAPTSSPTQPPRQTSGQQAPSDDIVVTVGETVVLENFNVTLNHVVFRRGGIFGDPSEEGQYIAINMTFENISDESQNIGGFGIRSYADNVRDEFASRGTRNLGGGSLSGELGAGRIEIGYVGRRIVFGASELIIEYEAFSRERAIFILEIPR